MENKKIKVLLVEDNLIEQRLFIHYVEKKAPQYDYKVAGSVYEALNVLSHEKFDIVISDHDLGDGIALDVIKAAQDTPTIVVTGAGDEETAINALKAGAYDYLIKDINQNYLKAIPITVEHALARKKTEKTLQLLSGAVMSTGDSVYITDLAGMIIFVNKAFCKTYGYKESEIIGQSSSILWIGKQQSQNSRSVFQRSTLAGNCEIAFYQRRKDSSIFPVSLSRSIIKDANRKDIAIVSFARDITAMIEAEEELRAENQRLKEERRYHNAFALN
jgi:PAS domain S-box-containing protein